MKVIIIGCGKIGYTIAKILSDERDVHVTVVDKNRETIDGASETIDGRCIMGTGLSESTLVEAGARQADLIVSVTNADETNILCCIMAKHLGTRHTVARVRDPQYAIEFHKLWKDLGIDMAINPEQQTAREISRLLRYPSADDIDTFVGGRVEGVSFKVSEASDFFVGKSVSQVFNNKMGILLIAVEREGKALIPKGDFVFEQADVVRVLGRPSNIMSFFVLLGKRQKRVYDVVIVGGSRITYYLAELLGRHTSKANVKIIEKDKDKCEMLSDRFALNNPRCMVIHGDGTDEDVLIAEDVDKADAFICLTDRDEENSIISLYALRVGVKKVITKVNHLNQNMITHLGLDSIVTPQEITSDGIIHYVNGLTGVVGNNIRTMHRIASGDDGSIEAIEFQVGVRSRCIGVPIKDLKLRKGILIGCIARNNEIIIPSGETRIQAGDVAIIIVKNNDVREVDDILTNRTEVLADMIITE